MFWTIAQIVLKKHTIMEGELKDIRVRFKCINCGKTVETIIQESEFWYNKIMSGQYNNDILFHVVCPECGNNYAFNMEKIGGMICQ